MDGSSSGVTFLSLAHLVDIAVVVNLAYRELKFPELDNKLHDCLGDILARAKIAEIDKSFEQGGAETYKEFGELKTLLNKGDDKGLWGPMWFRRHFFNRYIRTRLSLKIANANILLAIVVLIGSTAAAGYLAPIQDVYSFDSFEKRVWVLLLVVLTFMTCVPLVFIRLATLCEKHLFGFDPEGGGLVQKLAARMFKTKEEEKLRTALLAVKWKVRK